MDWGMLGEGGGLWWREKGGEGGGGGEGEEGGDGEFGVGEGFVEGVALGLLAQSHSVMLLSGSGLNLPVGSPGDSVRFRPDIRNAGLVGDCKISVWVDGTQGWAVTKWTSCVNERSISFFSCPSTSMENLIIAEYVWILGASLISVPGVGSSSSVVVVVDVVSTVANRSSDSKLVHSAFWEGSSEGRMKSPGRIEDSSAPPITWLSCSTAAFCQSRA